MGGVAGAPLRPQVGSPAKSQQYMHPGTIGPPGSSGVGIPLTASGYPTHPQSTRGYSSPNLLSSPQGSLPPGAAAAGSRGYASGERPLPPPPLNIGGTGSIPSSQSLQYLGPSAGENTDTTAAAGVLTAQTKNYTQLDLLRYDAPLSAQKITRMLNQLQFKLSVEEQYRKGIEKMGQLYKDEGDKKLRHETESKHSESEKKIQLLKRALKRYETLRQFESENDDEEFLPGGQRKENIRKPLVGTLVVSLKMARDLNHVPLSRKSSKIHNETTVVIKIEGNERGVSHPSRTDKWHEKFEIDVDKANEVELTIYDTPTGGEPSPIGMIWFRISDIVEALRRQKVGQEQGGGWVTAATAANLRSPTTGPAGPGSSNAETTLHDQQLKIGGGSAGESQSGITGNADGIDGWFAVEPAGAISLHLDFIKENTKKRPFDGVGGGLGRQGAVRKRKGDVFEMNGHQFVQRQFYQPILCALCQEFLLTGEGYQCEDCRYACHKKCYPKVVTKCISKSNAEGDGDEEKINHRIPHRFQTLTNVSANWCCHCGYMLPLGRKNAKKCSECGLTCHATCAHLVPDFCGMTMEMANMLLKQLRDIKTTQGSRKPVPAIKPTPPTASKASRPAPPSLEYPSSPAPAAAPPPGTYNVPVPADPRYASPPPPAQIVQEHRDHLMAQQPSMTSSPSYEMPRPTQGVSPGQIMPQLQQPRPVSPYSGVPEQQQPSQAPHIPQQVVQQISTPPPAALAKVAPQKMRKVGLDDFDFLAVLGKGNFGKVMLAEEKRSRGLFAIKVLKKEFIIENDEVESIQSEKRVFLAAAQQRHPFLLGLHSAFQTETRVYFVMEYVSGGDLMLHIQKKQFTLRQAKFYACEVLLALQYFHTKGIIYRDLKLDNILLTLDGHVKVADYGLCKEEMWFGKTTGTFCGTPEFMAPEILLEQRYTRAVDWWAFGVLTYEMLLGQSPFRGDDEDEIFDAILEDEPLYPMSMPGDAVALLQRLLLRDPIRRLGASEADAEDIKRHPFFRDVNFDDVYHKRIPPPYFPTIGNPTDVSNFDQEFTKEKPTLTPVHTQLSTADQQEFAGFSWVRD